MIWLNFRLAKLALNNFVTVIFKLISSVGAVSRFHHKELFPSYTPTNTRRGHVDVEGVRLPFITFRRGDVISLLWESWFLLDISIPRYLGICSTK